MGNDGEDHNAFVPTEQREFDPDKHRSVGGNLDMKQAKLEPPEVNHQLETDGTVKSRQWTERIAQEFNVCGCDHVMCVGDKQPDDTCKFCHLCSDRNKVASVFAKHNGKTHPYWDLGSGVMGYLILRKERLHRCLRGREESSSQKVLVDTGATSGNICGLSQPNME